MRRKKKKETMKRIRWIIIKEKEKEEKENVKEK